MNEQTLQRKPLNSSVSTLNTQKNHLIINDLLNKGESIFDFTLGDPKEPTPSFIVESLRTNITKISQYPLTNGLLELRQTASNWLKRRFDLDIDPKTQIISSNGSKEAIFHIPQVLLSQNPARNTFVFPEPAYPVYRAGALLAGGDICKITLKQSANYIFDVEDIPKEKIEKIAAIWVCYPHNPTGAHIAEKQAKQIYTWALHNNIVLLSDECYVDNCFDQDNPHISFLQVAKSENYKNLLSFFSLSKRSGMTGYRSGFIAGDSQLIEKYLACRGSMGVGTPDFIQHAAISAWNDDEHVQERNIIFLKKRKLVEDFLLRNNFIFLKSIATFYLWINIPEQYESSQIFCEELAKKTGIFATSGDVFGESCYRHFRLALVPTYANIEIALERWQQEINRGSFL